MMVGSVWNETWAQTLPDDVTGYETVTITIPATNYDADAGGTGLGAPQMAKVKFNRQFPLVITSDDGRKPEYISNWALMNGYPNVRDWQDYPYPSGNTFLGIAYDRTYMGNRSNSADDYQPMTFDDGTGHRRRFTLTSAVPPTGSSKTPLTASYDQINREDAKAMLRTGFSFAQHDVDDASSVETIKSDYTRLNTLWAKNVGIGLKVMVEPNGNKNYVEAAEQSDEICWNIYQAATQEHRALANTLTQWTDGTTPSTYANTQATTRTFPNSDAAGETAFANSVRTAITNGNTDPMFYGCHGLGTYAQSLLKDLATNASYKDKVWVTGADEFWEYYHIYNNIVIENVSYDGTNLTFDVKVPTYKKNQFRELTINIPGLTGTGAPAFSGADGSKVITGSYNADGGTGIGYTLNIGLESSITTHIDQLTAIYRDDQTNLFVKRDAQYLIDQLWDGTAKSTALNASPTYDLTIGSTLGGSAGPTLATIKTDTDGDKQFSVPRYIVSDGKLYETTAQASQPYYKPTVSTSAGAPTAIGYTEKDLTALAGNITPVAVSVVEGEDMAGAKVLGASFNSDYPVKIASGGLAGGVVSGGALTAISSLPRGSYKAIIGYGETWKAQGTFNYQVLVDGTQVHTFSNASATNNAVTEFTTPQFDITADGQPVTITTDNTNMNSRWIDYVVFVKTGSLEPVAPSITLSASAGTTASVKVGTSITITATAVQNGGSNFTGTAIYQCSDDTGTTDGDAKATSDTETATYTFTPDAAGTYYFKATATDGTLGSTTTEVITVTVVANINTYTLVIIDKSGGEAMTTTVSSSALTTDPLPNTLRSPYAENYMYYTTKAEAQANSGSNITDLAGFSQATIYVGYDVKSDGLKFDGSKPYVIYANSRYLHGVFREDQAHVTNNIWGLQRQSYDSWNSSNNNVTTTTFPFLDGSYLWYLQGGDPYNIRLQNKAARRYTSHENNANAGYRAGFTTDAASSARYCLVYWNGSTSAADYCALWNRDYSMYVYMNGGADNGSWRLDPSASKGEGKIYIADLPQLNINVHNPETHEVEYTVDGRFMSGATLPSAIPFYLQRAFTSGQAFYYTKADAIAGTNAISGTPDASSMTNDGNLNVYLTYTLDANSWGTSGTIKPSVDENDAYWMSMEFPDGNRKLEAANSGTYEVNPSQTTVTTETPKLQWAFIGTPYSFRLINRANSGRVMGVDKSITTATNAVMYENPSTSIACDWEMVNYKNGGGSTNPLIRLRGSISGETPLLFVLSQANQKTLSTTEANNNRISSFTLIDEVHPAIPPTVTLTTTAAQTIEKKTVVTLKATPVWNGTTDLTSLQFQYKVTGGADGDWENIGEAITPITSGTEYTKEFTPATAGTYSFRAVVTDADGTTGASAGDDATPTSGDAGLVTLSVVDDLQSDAAYSYKMKATLKDGDTEIASQWLHNVESETALTNQHYFFPRYILNGTTLYEVTANTPTRNGNTIENTKYGFYYSSIGQNDREYLTYNKVTDKENVVFYKEAEDLGLSGLKVTDGTSKYNWGTYEGSFTNFASCGYGMKRDNGDYGTITTLTAGKYIITLGLVGNNSTSDGNKYTVKVGEEVVGTIKFVNSGDGCLDEYATAEFSIYSSQPIIVSHSEANRNGLDYVYIQRTGDANISAPTVTLAVENSSSEALTSGGEALISTTVTLKATATMNGGDNLTNLKFQQKTGGGSWTDISTEASPTSGTEYTATYTVPATAGTVYFRALATTVAGSDNLTGYSQSDTSDDATAFAVSVVEHLTINEYTLHIIDNEGKDVFGGITLTKAQKEALTTGLDPLLTYYPQYCSPFVSQYLYFNTPAEAQANSGDATAWDQPNIYVGYTVDATKMGADKVHAIWANNRYMHSVLDTKQTGNGGLEYQYHNIYKIDNQKWDVAAMSNGYTDFTRNEISTSNLPFIDNTYMWKLGTDPYNVVIENKANGGVLNTNYNANPTYYAKSQESNANHYAILYYQGKNANSTVEITTDYCLMFDRTKSTSTTLAYNDTGSRYLGCSGDNDNQWRTMDKNHGAYAKLYVTQLPGVNINILNGDGEVEATLQGYLNSSATMPAFTPYFLWRAYTSGQTFYYDQAHTSQITGTPNASTIADNGNNVYVTYTLDTSKWLSGDAVTTVDTYFIKPNDANNYYWYMLRPMGQDDKALRADGGGLPAIVNRANEARANITSDPTTDKSKRSQWSFEGTPYNVKLINRYYGSNACLGIAGDCAAGGRFSMYDQNASGVITAWEVMSSLANSSKLFFRPQGSYGGETPHLYLGWDGGATQTGMTIAAGSNQACDFTYIATTEKEHPSTVHLTASTTTPYVDDPVMLTATATPDNKEVNNVTYLVIEQETSPNVWTTVGTAYDEADATTASMKDGTTNVVTATYTFTPSGAGTYNFRARAVIDNATQYSTDAASAGGDGSPVTITASVYTLVVGSNNYTLILVDKQGNELFSESNVPASRVSETNSISDRNGDPIDNSWRSPLVARYYYYSTKADAQSNSGQNLFDWSSTATTPTVYVGYATGTDIDLNSTHFSSVSELMTDRTTRTGTTNTSVRDASKFGKMYMLKFKMSEANYLEDGGDDVEETATAAGTYVYPYTNGDGPMYVYTQSRWNSQSTQGASTRTRWPWYLVSPTNDPYHVVVTSWQNSHSLTTAGVAKNFYSYFHTYYNTSLGRVITSNVTDDDRTLDANSQQIMPTEYMVLYGTTAGQADGRGYRLMTTNAVDDGNDGTTDERQTVTSLEQYWRNNPTALYKKKEATTGQQLTTDEKEALKTGQSALSTTDTDLATNGWHNYKAYVNAAPWGGGSKTYANDDHWFQTISVGDGSFQLVETDIDAVLVLIDQHGWELMRHNIVKHNEQQHAEVEAFLRQYDSPMVSQYKFYGYRNVSHKVPGYHKYVVSESDLAGTAASLADYPEKYSGGALYDLYVTYDVKEQYRNSYVAAATEAATSASQFLVLQGSNYAKANGAAIEGTADAASASTWLLKPNFDIDAEMGYLYDSGTDGESDKATTDQTNYDEGRNGFDPYNLRLQLADGDSEASNDLYLTTNATTATLDGNRWTGDGTSVSLVTLNASPINTEGHDNKQVAVTNQTFMAVQDANGNMRLMPRFDHSHVIEGFTTLAEPAGAQPANNETHNQTTRLTTGTITYHIIDNSGTDVFGAQTYTGPGFAIDRTLQSPMVEEYYFHSIEQDAKDNRTASTKTSIGLNDEVWVSYKAKADFSTKAWNIWNTDGLYMHAVSRNGENSANNLWWMSNQNQDRQNNATTTTLSTSTMPFLDNSFAWQFGTDPYNTTLLNKAAHRYVKQNDTGSNNGRMDHLVTDAASATPYAILYYDDTQTNDNAILYDRTHTRYVRADANEWRINSANREATGELVITQLPSLNINIVNADGEVECTLQGYYKSGCTWTPFVPLYLERLHTREQKFYYTLADATADTSAPGYVDNTITGTVNDKTVTTNGAVYVKYTLDSNWGTLTKTGATNDVMPSPTADNKIQWYAIKSKDQGRYFQAGTSADSELSNTTTQPGNTDSNNDKCGQWALIGTPYNLKLVNRYHGMGDYLGVPETSDSKAYVYSSEEGHVTTWEVVTGMGNQSGGLQIRPQRSFNGETTYGYVGYNSATGVYATPNGNLNNKLIWLLETPAKNITFKLYDRNGNAMTLAQYGGIADKTMTGYSPGDDLMTVFTQAGLKRRFCEYTFYSGYDGDTKEFSTEVTKASSDNNETVYVKWDYTDYAPVFMPWGDASTFTPASTNPNDYQYYLMDVFSDRFNYMWGVTYDETAGYTFRVDNNVGSGKARTHQFAFIGDPYTLKIYSRNAAKYICTNATGSNLVIDNTPEGGEEVEVVFDMPLYVTESLVDLQFRQKGTNNYIKGNDTYIWMSSGEAYKCRMRDMVVPVRIFKDGVTNYTSDTENDLKDYREYTVDLVTATTDSRITDTNLRASTNAVGTARDFRHAFCEYTFYRSYDWSNLLTNLIPTEGLPYFGGKDQYKRQFFGTYIVDQQAFERIYYMNANPLSTQTNAYINKADAATNGYNTSGEREFESEVKKDETDIYRWRFTGDPYDLQIHNLSMGEKTIDYALAVKVETESNSDAGTASEDNGRRVLLTDDLKENDSDTESYGQYSHWEIIERSSGNYVFWSIETGARYEHLLSNTNKTYYYSPLYVVKAPNISDMGNVEWQLVDVFQHYTINWHVMESNGSTTPAYAEVASKAVVYDENTVLTLADLPQELKRHFCEYNDMYSNDGCTIAIADNTLTVNAHGNIYVPYTLDSGAPNFMSAEPTSETAEKYWYEIGYPEIEKYIYVSAGNITSANGPITNIRGQETTVYDQYRWSLVGTPYHVKFYNKSTNNYLTSDGTTPGLDNNGTTFTLLDDHTGNLCAIYDAATRTYLNATAGMQTSNLYSGTAADFSNTQGLVKITLVLHYSDKTLRKYDSNEDGTLDASAANTLESISITKYQKVGKEMEDIMPVMWKRAFCTYRYYWDSDNSSTVQPITEVSTVNDEMVSKHENGTTDIYVHITYEVNSPFQWSKANASWEDKHWYYLVNNHIQGTERGKMVFRDSSPKLRVSTGLVDNRQYLNNYEWCVIGDPYGFKMLNHYDPDHKFNEYISVTDTEETFGHAGVQLEQQENNANHLFEMMPGKNSNNFWMHPIYTEAKMDEMSDEMSYIGNNGNGSAAIMPDNKYSQSYLRTNSSSNFRLEIRTDETLKEYVTYKNYVGSLKPDVIADNSELFTALENGTAKPEQLEAIHDLVDNPNNLVEMKQGYYRIVPYTSDKNRGTRSYVRSYLYGHGSGESGEVEHNGSSPQMGLADNVTTNNAMYNPATVFWFGETNEGTYPRYYIQSQGMGLTGNQMDTGDGFKSRYEDLGAAICQLRTNNSTSDPTHAYLSSTASGRTSTNQCFDEQAGYYKTRFFLQPVGSEDDNLLPLKLEMYKGKYTPEGTTEAKEFYFATIYTPYDMVLPADKAVFAYAGKLTKNSGNDTNKDWRLQCEKLSAQTVNGTAYAAGKFIPAGTPVLIRAEEEVPDVDNFAMDGYDRLSDSETHYVTLSIPDNAPATGTTSDNTFFLGQYLEQELPSSVLGTNEKIYVFGQSTLDNYVTKTTVDNSPKDDEAGFYVNKNTTDGSTTYAKRNNLYVRHNKIYLIEKDQESRYVTHEAGVYPSREFIALDFGDGMEITAPVYRLTAPDGVYDLKGHRVATPEQVEDGTWKQQVRPGVYIINGKKYVVK